MGQTNLSGPLHVGGVPIVPGMPNEGFVRGQLMGGRAYFVCNRTNTTYGDGRSADRPVRYLSSALALLVNRTGYGDAIYVLPGHAEDVDAADWLSDMGTASGFSIIGVGAGDLRPAFTWTAAAATWLLDTANIEIANLRLFLAGPHAAGTAITVAAPITVSGDGCRVVNNEIWWGYDANQIVGDGIIWTGDKGLFAGNWAFAETAAVPTNTFFTMTGADHLTIVGNRIKGATDGTTRGVIDSETTACTNLKIVGNHLFNTLAASTIALSLTAGDTGEITDNRFFVNSGILPITASLCFWSENYCTDAVGLTGALVGTVST